MSRNSFTHILNEIKDFTDYLYFHVLGEPLIHPEINEFIDIASKDFKINITTNGYLIDKIKENKNIRQLNISLHSFNDSEISFEKYIDNIFLTTELLKERTYINYRIWTNSKHKAQFISYFNKYYNTDIQGDNFRLDTNVFINFDQEFVWPDLDNDFNEKQGTCIGLKEHIGILVDGTVVPCCLDSKAIINLGNILDESMKSILSNNRVNNIINGFNNNKKCEKLCQKCRFYSNKK